MSHVKNIGVTECERDLGVLVSSDSTWHEQFNPAVPKAKRVLWLMKNTISSWSDEIAPIIYPTFVRPQLEFTSSVWNPHLEYNWKKLESVQRRITATAFRRKTRMTRFDRLEARRERGYFIQNSVARLFKRKSVQK